MTFDWQATYNRALAAFKDTPGANLEQQLREAFTQHPHAVTNAITKIIDAHQAGRVRSPWGALKTEVHKQIQREAIVDDRLEQRNAVQRAEQWIRNTGKHYDRWQPIHDDLTERNTLDLTPQLEQRLHNLWLEVRPEGELIEQQHEQRMADWKRQRDQLDALPVTHEGDKPPTCSHCGQTQGHTADCDLVLRLQVITEREAETKEPTAA